MDKRRVGENTYLDVVKQTVMIKKGLSEQHGFV